MGPKSSTEGDWYIAQDSEYHSRNFYLIYTHLSISEKSPPWRVFSSNISVRYNIYDIIIFQGDPTTPHPKIYCRDPNPQD